MGHVDATRTLFDDRCVRCLGIVALYQPSSEDLLPWWVRHNDVVLSCGRFEQVVGVDGKVWD